MILLDTQAALWVALEPEKLSKKASAAISRARASGGLAISDKTLWEVANLVSRGRIKLHASLREGLVSIEENFVVFPVTAAVAERSVLFSRKYPKDPADRIIGATALAHGVELVTADQAIRSSGEVPCIW